jgi:hypothetical protein
VVDGWAWNDEDKKGEMMGGWWCWWRDDVVDIAKLCRIVVGNLPHLSVLGAHPLARWCNSIT